MYMVRTGYVSQQEIREIRDAIKNAPETALDTVNKYITPLPCKKDDPCSHFEGRASCSHLCKHVIAHNRTRCVTVGGHEVMTARHTLRQMDSQSERIRLISNIAKVAIGLSISALAGAITLAALMWLN